MFGTLFGSDLETSLFDELRRFEEEMDSLFGPAASATDIRAVRRGTFPPLNVGATPERIDVYLFAAGLDPKSLDISIQQNVLAVAGTHQAEMKENAAYYRRERFNGDFRRVITLPEDVDPERVDAHYKDGVLHVTVPRRQAAQPRQIQVH